MTKASAQKKEWNPGLDALLQLEAQMERDASSLPASLSARVKAACALFRGWSAAQEVGIDGFEAQPIAREMARLALSGLPEQCRRDALVDACERALSGGENRSGLLPWLAELGAPSSRSVSQKQLRCELLGARDHEWIVGAAQTSSWSNLASGAAMLGDVSGLAQIERLGWAAKEREGFYSARFAQELAPAEREHWAWGHPWVAVKLGQGREEDPNAAREVKERRRRQACELDQAWLPAAGPAREAAFDALASRAAEQELESPIEFLAAAGHRPGPLAVKNLGEVLARRASRGHLEAAGAQAILSWCSPMEDLGLGEAMLASYVEAGLKEAWRGGCAQSELRLAELRGKLADLERLSMAGPGLAMSTAVWESVAKQAKAAREGAGRLSEGQRMGAEALELDLASRAAGAAPSGREGPRL